VPARDRSNHAVKQMHERSDQQFPRSGLSHLVSPWMTIYHSGETDALGNMVDAMPPERGGNRHDLKSYKNSALSALQADEKLSLGQSVNPNFQVRPAIATQPMKLGGFELAGSSILNIANLGIESCAHVLHCGADAGLHRWCGFCAGPVLEWRPGAGRRRAGDR